MNIISIKVRVFSDIVAGYKLINYDINLLNLYKQIKSCGLSNTHKHKTGRTKAYFHRSCIAFVFLYALVNCAKIHIVAHPKLLENIKHSN